MPNLCRALSIAVGTCFCATPQLSPTEFRAYTRYLDLLALAQAREGDGGLDADGSVRFDRDIVRDFAVERLDVPSAVVNDVGASPEIDFGPESPLMGHTTY